MPVARDCSQSEGKPEPASVFLSPVARDYPSRALRGFFMPATLRLFHQRTCATGDGVTGLSRLCSSQVIDNLRREQLGSNLVHRLSTLR